MEIYLKEQHPRPWLLLATSLALPVAILLFTSSYAYAQEHGTNPNTHVSSSYNVLVDNNFDADTAFKPKHVKIVFANKTLDILSYGKSVKDVLREQEIPLTENTELKPDADASVTSDMQIFVANLVFERGIETEVVQFKSKSFKDPTREIDTKTVVQKGRQGLKKVVYEKIYRDGILESKHPVREEVIQPKQDEIIALGTKRVYREMTIDGQRVRYWKTMRVFATSYDRYCAGCSGRGWTATGVKLTKGICAVDPTVIPFYTHFFVPGYGRCWARDVGGAIKEDRIDLGYEDLRLVQGQWHAHWVTIYIED